MARGKRAVSSTGIYHIMSRGIDQQNIFNEDGDYLKYLDILAEYQMEIAYELYAYCLMGNHLHLLIKEGNEDIGNTMKRIGVSYVSWFNWQYNRSGHLFQGRFRSEPVEDDAYFLTVLRYIHQNPIKAGLVKDVDKYKWSSYQEYMGQDRIVDINYPLEIFSSDRPQALAKFNEFHKDLADDKCLGITDKKITLSDKEIRDLVFDKYKMDLIRLKNSDQDIQDDVLLYLKKEEGVSLRQLSRITGFTIHRIYKVKG